MNFQIILPFSSIYVILILFYKCLYIFWLHDSFCPEQAMLQFLNYGNYDKKETTITNSKKRSP